MRMLPIGSATWPTISSRSCRQSGSNDSRCSATRSPAPSAPWLARLTGRVDAVVSGGSPIVGDYAYLYADIQRRSQAARSDPAAWAELDSRFDDRAALVFYRELSALPADSPVTDLRCPLLAFWGDQDEEIAFSGGIQQLASGLDRRGLQHVSFPGHDHEGMLAHINDAVPSVLAWFDRL
jgi:hypothetical protein